MGIGLVKVLQLPLLDMARHGPHSIYDVLNEPRLLVRLHETEEVSCLSVIVVAFTVVIPVGITQDAERRLLKAPILYGSVKTAGLVVHRPTSVRHAILCRVLK